MKRIILIFCIAFSVMAPRLSAEPNGSPWLVSSEWLNEHINDENLIVVDVSLSYQDYRKEHIPNSVYADWLVDLANKNEKTSYEMVLKEDFEAFMRRIGAQRDSTLVFYDNFQNRLAIRALFVTDYYGHQKTAVLDGGYMSWKQVALPMTSDIPHVEESHYTVDEIRPELVVDTEYVEWNLRNRDVIFVDSRPWEMYTGQAVGIMVNTGKEVARRGHLPGAISLPWKKSLNHQDTFKEADTLMTTFHEHGLKKGTHTIVFYCNEGVHGVFNWFVATKILGFPTVKVYEGSMGAWAEDPLRPMVTGIGF
jgi:thiosulfate/3-mercaptopyruvate sulfurtransferase